jgi:hypothetical protein
VLSTHISPPISETSWAEIRIVGLESAREATTSETTVLPVATTALK